MQIKVAKDILTFTLLTILIVCQFSTKTNAQVTEETGDLFVKISNIISNMPGDTGDDYIDPDVSDISAWNTTLDHLLNGDYNLTAASAAGIGYDLVQFTDSSGVNDIIYYVLETTGSNYWGTYVFNPNYCRSLVIQSPHALNGFNTGKQGVHVFIETQALFFCLSGTGRCNSSYYSSCDGITSICSASAESYRISDLSHTTSTIFQSTSEILFAEFSNSYFLQFHGFTKLATDPYVILSNGTQVTPDPDYIIPLSNNLYNEDNVLTFKIAHVDLSWTRLRGFTNTQGRLINSSTDVCNADATNANGRFIHIEQEKSRLRDDEAGWDKLANAVKNTFICYSDIWEGSESSDWNTATNWRSETVPTSGDNISIASTVNPLIIDEAMGSPAQCNHLEIQSSALVIVNPGKALTVNGNFDNSGTLTIESNATLTGSLIVMGDIRGSSNVERYIGGWSNLLHGWHFLSSPVSSQEINVFHTPGLGNDFYKWDENNQIWVNRTAAGGGLNVDFETEFLPGEGYLIANVAGSTQTFTGVLNNVDVDKTELSYTGVSDLSGWHLLGNPFSSSLIWNRTNWQLANIDATAKIWVESSSSYLDIPSGTGLIPAMQGFMVHVNTAPGSLVIDATDRSHHGLNWYKYEEINQIKLTVHDMESNTSQECIIQVIEDATTGFDADYDSRFLAGYAARFYSVIDEVELSTNTLPGLSSETRIPLNFIKNGSSEFNINAEGIDDFQQYTIYLTDLKTSHTQILNYDPVYPFKAEEGDDPGRFILHFSPLDAVANQALQIAVFSVGSTIEIRSQVPVTAEINYYSISGQLIMNTDLNNNSSSTINMENFKGIVIVSILTENTVITEKVFVW